MPLPAKDSFATYGGVKSDFIDVVDPTTDRSATEMNAALAALSMMTRTATRAIVQFESEGGYPDDGYVVSHESVWGNDPSVVPEVYHDAAGEWTITWPETVVDALNDEHDLSFNYAWASIETGSDAFELAVEITAPNVVKVILMDGATPQDSNGDARITLFVI